MISKRISLYFNSGASNQNFHSNTLARAIISNSIELYGEEVVKKLTSQPFAVTDLFPFIKSEKGKIFLLPKPLFPLFLVEGQIINYKAFKKAKYITEKAFEIYTKDGQDKFTQLDVEKGIIKLIKEETKIEFVSDVRPRNALLRATPPSTKSDEQRETNQFFFTEMFGLEKNGCYFVISAQDKNNMEILLSSIKLLAHRGLGGDISVGNGSFKIDSIEDYTTDASETQQKMLLSNWIPSLKDKEEGISIKYYNLLEYSPISITSKQTPNPLKATRLIQAGSIIENVHSEIIGTHIQIGTEKEPSFSWGYALTRGIKGIE
ncbi:MAG: type III-A CRISPR-associated RAMP protein Csm4 [Candidatus Heimdallarchaeum endolithica]|uniref:CRISPR system Cms protein Csm4 n=1 Tax=Candidatus Heimdallarchaeum endolithica TaxID=2876572 RepID=A0A9Y1FQE5_9ARCH|nr:MAG: type III-A CRISPR-associated RAMP protein Csm4 [Candidatus Heimdallarchaeum endolithica]